MRYVLDVMQKAMIDMRVERALKLVLEGFTCPKCSVKGLRMVKEDGENKVRCNACNAHITGKIPELEKSK